jgi:hypothetical protein
MPVKKKTPRLITRALTIVASMAPRGGYVNGRHRVAYYSVAEKRYRELRQILTDLDARESVVQPSRRAAHGLKERRRTRRID